MMRTLVAILAFFIPVLAAASSPSLDAKLPVDLDAAIALLDSLQDGLEGDDCFRANGFALRVMWCEQARHPIHAGLTVRQAIDLDRKLNAAGGDLAKPADASSPEDVRRVCGPLPAP